MKRRSRSATGNSTQNAQSRHHFDAERSIRKLQHRILSLEKTVADFEQRVPRLERIVTDLIGPGNLESTDLASIEQKKPGPKTIHDGALISQRDRLVQMLESYWPELEPLCGPPPDSRAIGHTFQQIVHFESQFPYSQRRHTQAAEDLLKHLPDLVTFLSRGRFRDDPRQIANAFAGRSSMGTWRSQNRCQAHPSTEPIGQRAICAYIRRRHLRILERLSSDYSLPNFVNALRAYRGKDPHIKALSAAYLYMCWKNCDPDPSILGRDPARKQILTPANSQHS